MKKNKLLRKAIILLFPVFLMACETQNSFKEFSENRLQEEVKIRTALFNDVHGYLGKQEQNWDATFKDIEQFYISFSDLEKEAKKEGCLGIEAMKKNINFVKFFLKKYDTKISLKTDFNNIECELVYVTVLSEEARILDELYRHIDTKRKERFDGVLAESKLDKTVYHNTETITVSTRILVYSSSLKFYTTEKNTKEMLFSENGVLKTSFTAKRKQKNSDCLEKQQREGVLVTISTPAGDTTFRAKPINYFVE